MAEYKIKNFIFYTVIFIIGFNILTVNAIKCHQCNSLSDLHCDTLKRDPKSTHMIDTFLKDCEPSPENHNKTSFCRKTTYTINYEESYRVVRACGWLRDISIHLNKPCISADNEGYLESICVCDTDGCNSARSHLTGIKIFYSICLVVGAMFLKELYF